MAFDERSQPPLVQARSLKRSALLSLAVKDDACLQIVYGEGGGCILEVAGGAAGVWIPLRDSLEIQSAGSSQPIHAGEALVTEHLNHIKAVGHANGRWLAMLGGKRAWERVLAGTQATGMQLYPNLHGADRELRRAAIAVARVDSAFESEGAVRALADKIAGLQAPLRHAIARCPGRTLARRRQVFLRLQRVRNFICSYCDQELDNNVLAHMANYSPCHFLRVFNQVFLETPHACLVNERLHRARLLLHSSDLAITEVALASGFENRSAFSRLFHQRFGATANEMRRRLKVLRT